MRELNKLVFQTISLDNEYKTLTGATSTDPRIYKSRTPVKVTITDLKSAFCVYYQMGSTHIYGTELIHGAQKNNYTYGIEIYAKHDITVSSIGHRIEKLFDGEKFHTTTFIVNHTFAMRGMINFDESRQLYTETVTVHLNNILTLNEAS